MFYTAFGLFEYFEDNQTNNELYINAGFKQTNTVMPQNIIQFTKKLNIEMYNSPIISDHNIKLFENNTIGIQMNLIFNFTTSIVGSNKPFITNIFNVNQKNNNKITFKYIDQYGYDINLISDDLINNALYNIIYLPIQPKKLISDIDADNINIYNNTNGIIISIDNDITLNMPSNKTFEIYIFPQKKINLIIKHFENKITKYSLDINMYHYVYYNILNSNPITIIPLNTVNLNFITLPTNVQLKDNSGLIYYNNFMNIYNNKFYNVISKEYDTIIMNCNNCNNNINQFGSRYKKMSYYGTENIYLKLPELNLMSNIITFSVNFKTNNIYNQILFDIGDLSTNNNLTSLFVHFENSTIRFNYMENNELKSTFLYTEENFKLNDDKWHNIIWTLIDDKWIIYIDGKQILNTKKTTLNKFYYKTNFIGKKNNINSLFSQYTNFIGFIDNFKIFNRELTIFEINNENIK